MHDTFPPPTTPPHVHTCALSQARNLPATALLLLPAPPPPPPPYQLPQIRGWTHTHPQATCRTAEPPHPGLEGEREVIWCSPHSPDLSPPGRGSRGVSTPPDTNASSQTHPDTTWATRSLADGAGRTGQSQELTRAHMHTHTYGGACNRTRSGRAAQGRSVPHEPRTQRHANIRHRPRGPRPSRAHAQPAAQPNRRAGSRGPGPGAQGSRSHRPPQIPNVTGPTCRTHVRPGRPQHLPPSWRLRGRGVGGRGGGWSRGLRAGSGAGLGWGASAAPAPRSAGPSSRQPSRTESAAAAASASSYARARGGARAGQSGVPPA